VESGLVHPQKGPVVRQSEEKNVKRLVFPAQAGVIGLAERQQLFPVPAGKGGNDIRSDPGESFYSSDVGIKCLFCYIAGQCVMQVLFKRYGFPQIVLLQGNRLVQMKGGEEEDDDSHRADCLPSAIHFFSEPSWRMRIAECGLRI
jgi:hypothetical protein